MHSLFFMNCYFQSCNFNMLSIGGAVIPSDPVDQLPRLFSKSRSLIDEPDPTQHIHPPLLYDATEILSGTEGDTSLSTPDEISVV